MLRLEARKKENTTEGEMKEAVLDTELSGAQVVKLKRNLVCLEKQESAHNSVLICN